MFNRGWLNRERPKECVTEQYGTKANPIVLQHTHVSVHAHLTVGTTSQWTNVGAISLSEVDGEWSAMV